MTVSMNLDSRTLVSRIADNLRDQIMSGQLAPGTRIRQDEFSEAFGVSRTPLREAFRLLEADGWIHIRPRSGVEVSRFSPAEVQDILTMRLLLEPLAIRVAALTHTPDDENALQELQPLWAAGQPHESSEHAVYDAANQEFHFRLYGLRPDVSTNPVHSSLRGFWERYSRYRSVYYWRTVDSIDHSVEEHADIVAAWCARDADRTELLLARHILHAGCSLVRSLTEEDAPTYSMQLIEAARRYDYDLS